MPAVCPTMRALPERLAAYMAVSARASSSSALTRESAGASSTTPMLTPALTCWRPRSNGLLQGVGDALRGGERVGAVLQQHRELVAAEPGHRVPGAGGAAQPLGHPDQQLVTRRVPQGVVDDLEVVQVEEEQRHRPQVAGVQVDRVLEPVPEQRAVGQPGQPVVEGLVAQLLLALGQLVGQPPVLPQGQVLAGHHQHHQRRRPRPARPSGVGRPSSRERRRDQQRRGDREVGQQPGHREPARRRAPGPGRHPAGPARPARCTRSRGSSPRPPGRAGWSPPACW